MSSRRIQSPTSIKLRSQYWYSTSLNLFITIAIIGIGGYSFRTLIWIRTGVTFKRIRHGVAFDHTNARFNLIIIIIFVIKTGRRIFIPTVILCLTGITNWGSCSNIVWSEDFFNMIYSIWDKIFYFRY